MDQNVAVCPFNKNHQMAPERLIFHLSKCKDALKNKESLIHCPYNFTHLLKSDDLNFHLQNCQSKVEFNKLIEYQNRNNLETLQKEFKNSPFFQDKNTDFWDNQKSAWSQKDEK